MGVRAYAKNAPVVITPTEIQNMVLVNRPATSHPLSPVREHATLPFGWNTRKPLRLIMIAAKRKSQSLYNVIGINQGKVVIIELTAAPPATAAIVMGSAQQMRVPLDVKSERILKVCSLKFILFLNLLG